MMNYHNKLALLSLSLFSALSYAMEEKSLKTLDHKFYDNITGITLRCTFHMLKNGNFPVKEDENLSRTMDVIEPNKPLQSVDDAERFVVKRINNYYLRKSTDDKKLAKALKNSSVIVYNVMPRDNRNEYRVQQNYFTSYLCSSMLDLSEKWSSNDIIKVGDRLITGVQLAVGAQIALYSNKKIDILSDYIVAMKEKNELLNNEISRQRILISNLHASNCSKDKEIKEKSDCVASMKKENKLLKPR